MELTSVPHAPLCFSGHQLQHVWTSGNIHIYICITPQVNLRLYSQQDSACFRWGDYFQGAASTTTTTNPPTCRRWPVHFFDFTPQTFLKFRFRVLFWRHSQTQLIGSLNDQIRSSPAPISSRQEHLRHRSQNGEEPSTACLLLCHVTDIARARDAFKGFFKARKYIT